MKKYIGKLKNKRTLNQSQPLPPMGDLQSAASKSVLRQVLSPCVEKCADKQYSDFSHHQCVLYHALYMLQTDVAKLLFSFQSDRCGVKLLSSFQYTTLEMTNKKERFFSLGPLSYPLHFSLFAKKRSSHSRFSRFHSAGNQKICTVKLKHNEDVKEKMDKCLRALVALVDHLCSVLRRHVGSQPSVTLVLGNLTLQS